MAQVKKKRGRGRPFGDHEARRVQIAAAACRVIVRMGIAKAGLADIAREMGCTTGVLSHYFSDKEQLLLFAKNYVFDRAFERAARVAADVSGFERLRVMLGESVRIDADMVERCRLLTIFNGQAVGQSRMMQIQARRNERFWRLIETELTELQRAGVLATQMDVSLEARGITAMMDGLADQIVMKPGAWKPGEAEALLTIYLDGVLARHGVRGDGARVDSLRS